MTCPKCKAKLLLHNIRLSFKCNSCNTHLQVVNPYLSIFVSIAVWVFIVSPVVFMLFEDNGFMVDIFVGPLLSLLVFKIFLKIKVSDVS